MDQTPPVATADGPIDEPPEYSWTVLSASAVPVSVSVVSLVYRSVLLEPVSSVKLSTVGWAGGVVSTITVCGEDAAPRLPATSVAWTLKLYVAALSVLA